jgi:hypothetical protein
VLPISVSTCHHLDHLDFAVDPLGGHSDWRLPNIKELESLTDDMRYNPAIDTTYFPNANASGYLEDVKLLVEII